MNSLVSIIMPSHNTGKYIKESIDSVLSQTYQNWELLIVDDCSTDDTDEVIASFSDERIKYFKNEINSGAAVSRNRALREAKGLWIAFLDSDDIWEPQKLEKQIKFMNERDCDFSFTDYRICLNGKWENCIRTGPNIVNLRKLYNWCYFSTITVMYNREKVGLIQISDLKKNNDYAMWFHALQKTDAYRLPECLSYYIKHNDSISSGKKYKLIKHHYLLYRQELKKNPVVAGILTANNVFHGFIKKFIYKQVIVEE